MQRAFDELRFGRARTLDLRATLPTAADAEARVESWLRERQATAGGEVLVITGRGRGSTDGIAVVRPAIERRLSRLRRQGVVSSVQEHTAGSFVVELAPLRELLAATRRKKDPPATPSESAGTLETLQPATRAALRALAMRTLEVLGAPRTETLIADEMTGQFSRLARSIPESPDREERLRAVAASVLEDLADA